MKEKSIVKSTLFVSCFIIFTKILGLFKQIAISSNCGATFDTDAFYIATGVIGQIISLVFSALAVTTLTEYTSISNKKDENEANSFIKTLVIFIIPILIIVFLLFFIFSSNIATLLSPKFKNLPLLSNYIKIVSLSVFPFGLYIILNVVLEYNKSFLLGRFHLLFQNLFLIIAVIFFYNHFGGYALIVAYLLSNIVQCLIIYIKIRKRFSKASIDFNYFSNIKNLIWYSLPLILGNAAYEINDIVDKQIATGIGEGTASLLTYSSTLNEIITGVIITSLSVVLFVHFAEMISKCKFKEIEITITNSIMTLLLVLLPATILFIISGKHIINILYGNGAITNSNLNSIYYMLIGYAVGFVFQSTRIIYIKALTAFNDTKNVMLNGLITIVINILLSIYLSSRYGVIGITLSTSISVFIASILLHNSLKKHIKDFSYKSIKIEIVKIIVSCILPTLLVIAFEINIMINHFINIFISFSLFFIIYLICLYLLRSKYIFEIKKIFINTLFIKRN